MKKKGEIVVPAFSWSFPPGLSKLALALLASAASTVQLTSLGIGALLYWGCCSNGGCLGSFGRQWSRGWTRGRTATYYSNVVARRRSRAPRWSVVLCSRHGAGGTDSETQTAFAATARELTQHIHSVSSNDFWIRFFLQQSVIWFQSCFTYVSMVFFHVFLFKCVFSW